LNGLLDLRLAGERDRDLLSLYRLLRGGERVFELAFLMAFSLAAMNLQIIFV
jgi:hypothetical protein